MLISTWKTQKYQKCPRCPNPTPYHLTPLTGGVRTPCQPPTSIPTGFPYILAPHVHAWLRGGELSGPGSAGETHQQGGVGLRCGGLCLGQLTLQLLALPQRKLKCRHADAAPRCTLAGEGLTETTRRMLLGQNPTHPLPQWLLVKDQPKQRQKVSQSRNSGPKRRKTCHDPFQPQTPPGHQK